MDRTNIVRQNIFHIPILKFETVKSFYNVCRRKPVADKSFRNGLPFPTDTYLVECNKAYILFGF